jgi:hypothetical protein
VGYRNLNRFAVGGIASAKRATLQVRRPLGRLRRESGSAWGEQPAHRIGARSQTRAGARNSATTRELGVADLGLLGRFAPARGPEDGPSWAAERAGMIRNHRRGTLNYSWKGPIGAVFNAVLACHRASVEPTS